MSGVKLIAGNCLVILQCHLVWQTLEREGSITITYLLQSQPISHPSLNWNRRPRMTRPSSKTAHIAVKRWVWVRVCVEICDILTLLRNRFVITSMLLCLYCLISSLQTDNKLTLLSIFWKRRSSLCFEDPTVAVWFHIWRWLPPMYAEPWRRRTRASPTCCWLPGKTRKISLTLLNPAWDQVWAQQLE